MNLTLTKVIRKETKSVQNRKYRYFINPNPHPEKIDWFGRKFQIMSRDGTDSKIPGQSDTHPDENWVRTCFLDRNPNSTFLMKISIFTHNKSKLVFLFEIQAEKKTFLIFSKSRSKFWNSDFDQNHYLYLASTDGLSSICPPVHFRGPHGWMDGWTVRRRPSSSVEAWFVFILRSSIENFVFLTRNDLWYKVLLSAAPSLVMVDFWQFLYRVQYTKRMFGKLSNI